MKQMKNYLFLFIALLGMLFSGCEKDLYEDAIPKQNYAVKEYTFQEALQKQEFKTSYTKFDDQIKKLKTANRGAGDTIEDYNFIIDSSKIKEIVYDGKTSYTMAIKRDEITNGYFENLILEINNSNEKQAYIIKYFPSEEMKYNDEHQEFEFVGSIEYSKVHGPTTFFGEGGSSEYDEDNSGPGILTITCVSYLQCCQTQNGSVGSYHNLGPSCTNGAFIRLVVVCSQNGIPIGGSGSNTTGPSGFLGGGTGQSGQGSSSSNYNPTPIVPVPVVTAPVFSILNPPMTDNEINVSNIVANQFYKPLIGNKKMYLHTTLGLYQALTDYLSLHITNNVIDSDALAFANELVDLSMNNPTLTLDDILNNKIKNEPTCDLDNNIEGDFDNTTYSDFNPQQTWSNIPSVIPISNFVGWNRLAHPNWQCMEYSKEQLRVMGYKISNYSSTGQTFQIYTAQNGVNNTALANGLSYLKYALSNGIPVIVGIDNHSGSPNPGTDNTTDHFIVIVGMGTDATGKYFQFYDNASGDPLQGTSISNKLYYNSTTGIISGSSMTNYAIDNNLNPYKLTMIRKSKLL